MEALELNVPIYHVHFLSQERIAKMEEISKEVFRTEKNRLSYRISIPWLCQYVREQVDKSLFGLDGNKWSIVTPIREPIARNISGFFQQLELEILDTRRELRIKSVGYNFETVVKLEDSMNVLADLFLEKVNPIRVKPKVS